MASVASVAIRNSPASTGARNAIPPMSRMSSEPAARSASSAIDEEHRRHDQAVVDRLHQRALGAGRGVVGGEDPERDEPELGHRRVAEDQPRVRLRERHQRAVEDREQREHEQDRLEVVDRVGEQRQHDAQEAVGGDLGDHAGEDGQRRQRHRPVGVGHPAVEREGRHLDQERERERDEDPLLRALRQPVGDEVGEREAQLGRARARTAPRSPRRRRASPASRRACRRPSSPRPRSGRARPRCRPGSRTAPASGRRRGRRGRGPARGTRPARPSRRSRSAARTARRAAAAGGSATAPRRRTAAWSARRARG